MNSTSVERLLLKRGEQPTAAHLNALNAHIAQQQSLGGRGVRTRTFPWGTHTHYTGGGSGGAGSALSEVFRPSIGGNRQTGYTVSWERGLIEGVEPTIEAVPISGDKETKRMPSYTVLPTAFGELGEAHIYFRLQLTTDYGIEKIEPIALPETPKAKKFTAYKLALILFEDGTHWRALNFNQGHLATNRLGGLANHIFWAK